MRHSSANNIKLSLLQMTRCRLHSLQTFSGSNCCPVAVPCTAFTKVTLRGRRHVHLLLLAFSSRGLYKFHMRHLTVSLLKPSAQMNLELS
jgi:hypothetical protein